MAGFFDRLTTTIKDTGSDFFNAAITKLEGGEISDSFGGKLFSLANLKTKERQQEISLRAATKFRKSSFGQNFISDVKRQEIAALFKNPLVLVGVTLLSGALLLFIVKR